MEQDEFDKQVGRLVETYGAKAYPAERQLAIWPKVKHLQASVWSDVVTALISEHQYAPMLSKIEEAIRAVRNRSYNRNLSHHNAGINHQPCAWCDTSGAIIATHREDGTAYAFLCPDTGCRWRLEHNWAYPEWNQGHHKIYEPHRADGTQVSYVRTRRDTRRMANAVAQRMPGADE